MSATDQNETVTCRKCHTTYVPSFINDFYADGADPQVGLCESCKMGEVFGVNNKPPHPLPNGHEEKVCKAGCGEATCAFLTAGGDGFRCAKDSVIEKNIRQRLAEGTMRAKGDNCSGPPDFTPSPA